MVGGGGKQILEDKAGTEWGVYGEETAPFVAQAFPDDINVLLNSIVSNAYCHHDTICVLNK